MSIQGAPLGKSCGRRCEMRMISEEPIQMLHIELIRA